MSTPYPDWRCSIKIKIVVSNDVSEIKIGAINDEINRVTKW